MMELKVWKRGHFKVKNHYQNMQKYSLLRCQCGKSKGSEKGDNHLVKRAMIVWRLLREANTKVCLFTFS